MLRPIIKPRPSFGCFSTVIYVKFSFANFTAGANFKPFFVHGEYVHNFMSEYVFDGVGEVGFSEI